MNDILIEHCCSESKLIDKGENEDMLHKYLKLMRVRHYIKNLLIFLPLFFSTQIGSTNLFLRTLMGFVSFSFITSVVYILNDIQDLENDRNHHEKKRRPLASGAITISRAIVLLAILSIVSVALLILIKAELIIYVITALYVLINIGYSFGLKNIPLVDVSIIVAGFMLRIFYGGAFIHVVISEWMYLTILSLSFFLALGKRRNEMKRNGVVARNVLRHYNADFLDRIMYVCLGLAIAFYSLWCVMPSTANSNTTLLVWTVPIVLLIMMKYSMIIENDSNGDPAEVLLSDKSLIGLVMILVACLMTILYW